MENEKILSTEQRANILEILKMRFEKNMDRHMGLEWNMVLIRLEANDSKLWSLNEMERSGGEPDIIFGDSQTEDYVFYDCSSETPIGRRSLCYDRDALNSRKENKPKSSAMEMAGEMGIEMLNEEQYRELQKFGAFDAKSSSWVNTPDNIRKLGGALFCDLRYGTVFVYHNGAESYYSGRGFRGMLRV
ncbi:MAG: hypothetical protein H6Q59_1948 [Firmicutes bacterium]|nr:hypothetical protein [Bacillota bacterium]